MNKKSSYNATKVTKKNSILLSRSKEDTILELVQILKTNPLVHNAYIFGSFYSREFNADSDLDLLVIMNTSKNFIDRPLDFPEILNLDYQVDLLVYTEEEFKNLQNEKKVGFWKSAFETMKQII